MHKIMFVALCALSFWCAAVQAVPATEAKGKNEEKAYTVDGQSGLTLADPFVLYENGVYYAYGTHAADGIEVYTSRDMRHWTFYGLALDRKNSTATRGFWAPEIYHIGSLYYMYFTGNERLFCATSTSPVGPFIQRWRMFSPGRQHRRLAVSRVGREILLLFRTFQPRQRSVDGRDERGFDGNQT